MPLTRDEIRTGYWIALGREPESDEAYESHGGHQDLRHFREVLFGSDEGLAAARSVLSDHAPDSRLADNFNRTTVCHIHIEKTGGTSLHRMLASCFDGDRISPSHWGNIHCIPLEHIGKYDFISSHLDYLTSTFIPRANVLRTCLFRHPVERLISFYRFHRAHPPDSSEGNRYVELARGLTPEDFFTHPEVRASPRLNNVYFRVFATSLSVPVSDLSGTPDVEAASLGLAGERIRSLAALGVTDRMEESTRLIFHQLGLTAPPTIEAAHVTNELPAAHPAFSLVSAIDITPDLAEAMAPLVAYDDLLYGIACDEFDRRLAAEERRASEE